MDIFKSLETSATVSHFEVLDFKVWETGIYVKLMVLIKDGSFLHVREYNDERERHYSFHWQDPQGKLLLRWDNAPHHKELKTFPHHRHNKEQIEESTDITLSDVLKCIENAIHENS